MTSDARREQTSGGAAIGWDHRGESGDDRGDIVNARR